MSFKKNNVQMYFKIKIFFKQKLKVILYKFLSTLAFFQI